MAPRDLLLAAEAPLLREQPGDGISLMRRRPGDEIRGWGSGWWGHRPLRRTDGAAGPANRRQLLGCGFAPPDQWTAKLQLFSLSEPRGPRLQPIIGWDLLEAGLLLDNWEAMALGPELSDGRQTLVLASDDNFNPLQSSWLAVLTPRRTTACTD